MLLCLDEDSFGTDDERPRTISVSRGLTFENLIISSDSCPSKVETEVFATFSIVASWFWAAEGNSLQIFLEYSAKPMCVWQRRSS